MEQEVKISEITKEYWTTSMGNTEFYYDLDGDGIDDKVYINVEKTEANKRIANQTILFVYILNAETSK